MRHLILLSVDFKESVNRFTIPDLKENLHAANVLSRVIIGEYNIHEWDSSVKWDQSLWKGFELQLFLYGRMMAERLDDTESMILYDDLISAYEGDPGTATQRPAWTFDEFVIESHIGYLMSVTQEAEQYGNWPRMYPAQHLPVPLAASFAA